MLFFIYWDKNYKLYSFLLFINLLYNLGFANDILGCGGFVKSDVGINFSRVEIKLYTRQGSLKYQTDCAPNNGYYLIPLYDKGDYILKVEPPVGWSFEPHSVSLHVDGSTDPCSLGKDINFIFKGFSVFGKVISHGTSEGPSGVKVSLKKATGEVIRETHSGSDGHYGFTDILPGDYILEATHSKWLLEKSKVSVTISQDNGRISEGIIVQGYDVSGQVISEGEPIQGVNFLLFSKGKLSAKNVVGCNKDQLKGFNSHKDYTYICYVTSLEDGSFNFQSLPFGQYKLLPFYKGEHIEFDVHPAEVDFVVNHDSVILQEKFQVQGFSVSGKVVSSVGGKGLKGAKVFLDGKEQAVTQANGIFHLDNMQAGNYKLEIEMPNIIFKPVSVKITPNTPHLPDVVASEFALCGNIIIYQIPSEVPENNERIVSVEELTEMVAATVASNSSGYFCTQVSKGQYVVKPVVSNQEAQAGLRFYPTEKKVYIIDEPILNINFIQFRARVQGKVLCLENCGEIQILLSSAIRNIFKDTVTSKTGHFLFENCLPGTYEIKIMKEDWCWKKKTLEITVTNSDVNDVEFRQVGYHISIISSHDTLVKVKYPSSSVNNMQLQKGITNTCVPEKGSYEFMPEGCHTFKETSIVFASETPAPVTLTAVKHLVTGSVLSEALENDIIVTLKKQFDNKEETETIHLQHAEAKEDNLFMYKLSILANQHSTLNIHVSSGQLLFRPANAQISVADDCLYNVFKFIGRTGLFINGQITPPIEGVKITIHGPENSVHEKFTNKSGGYSVGPLDSEVQYNVDAEKEGYIFTKVEKIGHFKAFKLAEVIVLVEGENKEPLAGVLLSLSGGIDYRKNSITHKDGHLSFSGLSPGQYFLRPMLKEYKFQPAAKMIEVTEGATVKVTVSGKRVAFSCYGVINSLTGEAEPGVAIEAIGIGHEPCNLYQEEAVSEQDGTFRIRGLQPNCEYIIHLKQGAEVNQHIERSTPKERIIKVTSADITGIRVIIFRRFNQMDISGNVVTNQEFLSSLKVRLYREDSPDQAVHTVALGQSSFFHLPALSVDNKAYILHLDSSLPSSSFHIETPSVSFRSNISYRHFTLQFHPRSRAVDQEMSQGSLLAFPLILVFAALVYNYSKVLPLLNHFTDIIQAVINPARATGVTEGNAVDSASGRRKPKPRKIQ